MIRDVTGLNEARDASTPDKDSLVGLQKLAAANSNTATRHILQSSLYLTLRACENISLRVADSLNYDTTRSALENSISQYNVGTLDELAKLNMHDFGIFLNLEPDEEEKAQLEQNIQMALQQNQIYLEDAIDIREIKNLTLANQFLKYRRKKKQEADQAAQQANIQAQAQANAKLAQETAMAEVQKQEAIAGTQANIKKVEAELDIQKMQVKLNHDQQMAQLNHQFDMELKRVELETIKQKESMIEERKDQRARIQGTQQSKMIAQRTNDSAPIDFESGDGSGQVPFTSNDFTQT